MRGLIGKKVGMTQVFNNEGGLIPVTVLEAGPCIVTQVKTQSNDGYDAIQVGFEKRKKKHSNKALDGHFARAGKGLKRFLAEFVPVPNYKYETGQEFGVSLFKEGEYVDVTGTSKGKGFQGVVKRHGFRGVGDATHGQHNRMRAPGSIGAASYPARVFKGMKMAGRMGGEKVKVLNLRVLKVMPEKNLLLVKGCVPGHKNSYVIIQK